jgi:hypothetical protein
MQNQHTAAVPLHRPGTDDVSGGSAHKQGGFVRENGLALQIVEEIQYRIEVWPAPRKLYQKES